MVMEETLKSGVDQMKMIFSLCDRNNEGFIYAQDFRKIGQEHFDKPQQVDALLQVMDPLNTGRISFAMFCRGVEAFLPDTYQGSFSRDSSSLSSISSTDLITAAEMAKNENEKSGCVEEYDGEGFQDTVFPAPTCTHLTNGYQSSSPHNCSPVELMVNGCHDGNEVVDGCHSSSNQLQPLCSTPCVASQSRSSPSQSRARASPPSSMRVSPPSSVMWSRESPTLLSRQQHLHRHQLTLPESSSQGSTPAEQEAEEEVSRLSDQLHELSSRLEELEVEQKDSEGFRVRLKKENAQLRERLEEYEDMLRTSEQDNKMIRSESQKMLKASVSKVRRESETQVMELRSQLENASKLIAQLEGNQVTLKAQVLLLEEEKVMLEKDLLDKKAIKQTIQDELRQTKDLHRLDEEKWELEKEAFTIATHERDAQIRQLHQDLVELQSEQKTKSITESDMEREIHSLKRSLELATKENEELQSKFLLAGRQLVAASNAPPSLEMEMETASKDEVVKALHESEEMNARLNLYIDGLLTSIIEKHPELLEIS